MIESWLFQEWTFKKQNKFNYFFQERKRARAKGVIDDGCKMGKIFETAS